jgi:predicted RNA methylase
MVAKILEAVTLDIESEDLTPVDGLPSVRTHRDLAEMLRSGNCPPDRTFDYHLPRELRIASRCYWTPLAVAMKAAGWLDDFGVRTVVDIGSGAGKFCVAAALAGRCEFIGLEQRSRLVGAARELAKSFECDDRVSFHHFEFGEAPAPRADAYYFFNPFGENLFSHEEHLDDYVELSEFRYARDVAAARALLESASLGTYVLTYNGFGAALPAGYREVRHSCEFSSVLRLWLKVNHESRIIDQG